MLLCSDITGTVESLRPGQEDFITQQQSRMWALIMKQHRASESPRYTLSSCPHWLQQIVNFLVQSSCQKTTKVFYIFANPQTRSHMYDISVPDGFDPSAWWEGFQAGDFRGNNTGTSDMFCFFSRAWGVMTETWQPVRVFLCFCFMPTKQDIIDLSVQLKVSQDRDNCSRRHSNRWTDSVSTSVHMKPLDVFNETLACRVCVQTQPDLEHKHKCNVPTFFEVCRSTHSKLFAVAIWLWH